MTINPLTGNVTNPIDRVTHLEKRVAKLEATCKLCETEKATEGSSDVTGSPQYCRQCYKSMLYTQK